MKFLLCKDKDGSLKCKEKYFAEPFYGFLGLMLDYVVSRQLLVFSAA
jgi:hypothetical protein